MPPQQTKAVTYCPFRNDACVENCALKFAYPDRFGSLCAFHAMTIMLYNLQAKLTEIEDAIKRPPR